MNPCIPEIGTHTMSRATSIHLFRIGMFLVLVSFLLVPMDTVVGKLIVWKVGFYLGALMALAGIAFWVNSGRATNKTHELQAQKWAASAPTNEEHERRLMVIGEHGATQALLAAGIIGAAAALAPKALTSGGIADFFSTSTSDGTFGQDGFHTSYKSPDEFETAGHIPKMNVDGTPMMGNTGFDIHGNAFGVTQDMVGGNDFMSNMSSSSMDFGSNNFGMSSDPFSS